MMIAVVESFATAATIKYIASIVTWPAGHSRFGGFQEDMAERASKTQRKKTGGTSNLISFLMILMAFSVQVIHVKALPKVLSTNRLRGTLSTALVARWSVSLAVPVWATHFKLIIPHSLNGNRKQDFKSPTTRYIYRCIIQELRMMMFEMLCFPFSCKTASIPSAIHGSMLVSITSYTTQNQELPDLLTSRSDILLRFELEESPTSDPSCRGHNSTEKFQTCWTSLDM